MTAQGLAALALKVLDSQQNYFRSRTPAALTRAKALESELRRAANDTLSDEFYADTDNQG